MKPQHASHPQPRNRTMLQLALLIALLVVCAVGLASSAAQSPQDNVAAPAPEEREFKNTIPEHVPVKVRVKNEPSFKKLENRNWARELEIEVKNTGSKPIYFMYMNIVMRDFLLDGYPLAFQVDYGRKELVRLDTPVQPDDVPILPGESVTLKVSDSQWKGYEAIKRKENKGDSKRVTFDLQLINFGDGTGLTSTQGTPTPNPARQRSQNMSGPQRDYGACPPTLAIREADSSGQFLKAFDSTAPANFLRVNFYPSNNTLTTGIAAPVCDLCGCQNIHSCFYGQLDCASCPCDNDCEFFTHTSTSCSDPLGECQRTETVRRTCQTRFNGQQLCTFEQRVGPCAIGDPTPTPTPTPSATPRQCTQPRPSLDCACNPDLDAWLCKERS